MKICCPLSPFILLPSQIIDFGLSISTPAPPPVPSLSPAPSHAPSPASCALGDQFSDLLNNSNHSTQCLIDLLAPTYHSSNKLNNHNTVESEQEILPLSSYMNTVEIITALKKKPSFSIFSLNCQSLNAKFSSLQILLHNLNISGCHFSAMCLQESWLTENSDHNLFQLEDYNLINQPLDLSKHGGLVIYLHKDFHFKKLPNVKSNTCENLFIEVSRPNGLKKVNICNLYRPPAPSKASLNDFISDYDNILGKISSNNKHCVISGDFNIDLLKSNVDSTSTSFLDNNIGAGFFPCITHPTRLSPHHGSSSLIDNIFFKPGDLKNDITSGILSSQISDHFGYFVCICDINHARTKLPPKYIYTNSQTPVNVEKFKIGLQDANLFDRLDCSANADINRNYKIFDSTIEELRTTHIPMRKCRFNKRKHKKSDWITDGILKSINFRDNLYKQYVNSIPGTKAHFKHKTNLDTYNKILNSTKRAAKKVHLNNLFVKSKNDIKKTWNTINEVLNRRNNNSSFPETFQIDGVDVSDRKVVANAFNFFFTGIGELLAANMGEPKSGITFQDYLANKPLTKFQLSTVDSDTILKKIDNLKSKSSYGRDYISNTLLKKIKTELCEPIKLLINQSFELNKFPDLLKISKVSPILKKGDPTIIDNYRPISLLPAVSKVFESIIYEQVYEYFTTNKILYCSQYGFRSGHSTEQASIELVDRILNIMQNDDIPFSIYMDLSKAFDTLNHNILLEKLRFYGLSDETVLYFESYLRNRKQYVILENTVSDVRTIQTGVPQGSILGPLFFLIYINDISYASKLFSTISYADDTTLLSSLRTFGAGSGSDQNVSKRINAELDKISEWLIANRLALNVLKTKFMVFHQPNKKVPKLSISINNIPIEKVENFTFLGLTIDYQLNWKEHITKISNKISKILGIMARMKNFLPCRILKMIYNSLILPHLNFSLLCWGYGCTNRIQTQQNKAVRLITGSSYCAHTTLLFKKLNLLKLSDIFLRRQFIFYYQLRHELLPKYLNSFQIETNENKHSYSTRFKSDPISIIGKKYTKKRIRINLVELVKSISTSGSNVKKLSGEFITSANYQIPRADLIQIFEKLEELSLHGFCNHTKNVLISNYDETTCTKKICFPCNRQ